MLDTLIHSGFFGGVVTTALGYAMKDFAIALVGGITMAFGFLESHPNKYVTKDQLEQAHKDLLVNIAKQAEAASQPSIKAVNIDAMPALVPVEGQDAGRQNIPVYNQD